MSNNTGGPAFPTEEIHDQHSWENGEQCRHLRAEQGMTLRDYFAAKAMQASRSRNSLYGSWDDLAKDAYEIADAMLKARES